MGMFFRSEQMNYCELRVSYDSAWAVLGALGTLGTVELEDLNKHLPTMNRPFINYVKRCNALLEKINFLTEMFVKTEFKVVKTDEYALFMTSIHESADVTDKTGDAHLEQLEAQINEYYTSLKRNQETLAQLITKHNDLVELKTVYTLIKPVLPQSFKLYYDAGSDKVPEEVRSVKFCYICGVIKSAELEKFQKLVYRVTRGNSFLKLIEIPTEKDEKGNWINVELDEHGNPVQKNLFFLAFQSGMDDLLRSRLMRLCETFGVRRYNLPPEFDKVENEIATANNEIINLLKVKENTQKEINDDLTKLSQVHGEGLATCSMIEELKLKTIREKCIYEHFDKMRLKDRIFYARVWIPVVHEGAVRRVFDKFSQAYNFSPPELEWKDWKALGKVPPTYFRTNDFTKPFLDIVETYGVPRYQEMNPAPWSIATFPYQFGVMFGDVGHGGILFAATSYLVYMADEFRAKKMVPKALLQVRYLFWLMGFFAFYCGIIYNEFFAITLKWFKSCHDPHTLERDPTCTYPVGLDPAWYSAKNEVSYFNSFKMKLSIIIGVLHMMMGIFLRGANNIYFGQPIDFVFEFIPQVIFMSSTFGYMVVCIFIKWSKDWTGRNPPSILNIYTGMGITTPDTVLWGDPSGAEQTAFQQKLFVYAGICVPIMLFVKPILVYLTTRSSHEHHVEHNDKDHEAAEPLQVKLVDKPADSATAEEDKVPAHDDHGFGEIMIHQLIEVIEFVLGSVSNTASYLRLWALSLAHSQLAAVFLEMTITGGMKSGNALSIFIGFPVWIGATFGVLMMMDLLECFLHTLRLHWVEFMNKFYKGDGYKFTPLCFEKYAETAIES